MSQRDKNKSLLQAEVYDVLIIGGGINGAVAAAALSADGAKVALVDKGDFSSFTSQNSSNLVWGGIKYMESFEFGLVRRLCTSRNLLIQSFPSTIKEIRFLTSVQNGFRHHPFVLWLGAWFYWLIGNGFTQTPRLLSPKQIKCEEAVIDTQDVWGGMEYSDAYLFDNDARFVFGFVRSALKRGCIAVNYHEVLSAERKNGIWHTRVRDTEDAVECQVRAKVLVNAAGAYVDTVNRLCHVTTKYRHVFSKGIHLIVNRVTPNRRVLAFFASDGRLFFVMPMGNKTCVGTTDTRVDAPQTSVTEEDRNFVLDNINRLLALQPALTHKDIIAERCGVRPLAVKGDADTGDFLQLSRKHALEVDKEKAHISIFGGKLTDCINVGNEVLQWVKDLGIETLATEVKWYGESSYVMKSEVIAKANRISLEHGLETRAASMKSNEYEDESLGERLWRRYGQSAGHLLDQVAADPSLAEELIDGTDFRRIEMRYVAENEMIVKLEDFLRRRTKIALTTPVETLRQSEGLRELCNVLFGDDARRRWNEYFLTDVADGHENKAMSSR